MATSGQTNRGPAAQFPEANDVGYQFNALQAEGDLRYLAPTATGIAANGKPYLSLDQAVANLNRTGALWEVGPNGTITYSFLEKAPGGQYRNPHETYLAGTVQNFSPFTAEQRETARDAIELWDDLIAPSFREINGKGADIVFMNTGEGGPSQAGAFIPEYQGKYGKINGDIYVNAGQPDNYDLYYGGYGQTAMAHEIGHAIGLSHTGDYNYKPGELLSYGPHAQYFQDSYQYSIMSYFDHGNTGAKGFVNWNNGGYPQTPQTPMVHDIAAVQAMYGADLTTRTGDTTYGFNSNADRAVFDFTQNINPFLTIYDAGGHDTLDLSGWTHPTILDLRPGAFSSGFGENPDAVALNALYGTSYSQALWVAIFEGRTNIPGFLSENIGIAYNTIIEDGITGKGNDTLRGNDVGNRLDGGAGHDNYTGGLGADTFVIGEKGFTDTITDFKSGEDRIDLSAFGISAKNVSFNATGKTLFVDLDGNGTTDLAIVSQADQILVSDILFA